MSESMDLYRPDKPHHMKGRRIMVPQEVRDQIVVYREVHRYSWVQIGRMLGHSQKWAYAVGKSMGLFAGRLKEPAGRRPGPTRERVRQYILAQAKAGRTVGKNDAIAAEVGCHPDTVRWKINDMIARGEIQQERLPCWQRRFVVLRHGP